LASPIGSAAGGVGLRPEESTSVTGPEVALASVESDFVQPAKVMANAHATATVSKRFTTAS
jgi:hypothetical protein